MTSNLSTKEGLVPIVFGATGHRDIPEVDHVVLRQAICSQLQQTKNQYPNSPLILVSGLAEGADRIMALCALECGWSIAAILPLEQLDYESDFQTEESKAEFRQLLGQCVWVTQLSESFNRPECYRQMGFELTRQSQVLVSLWDGNLEHGPGGTAEVIRAFRQGLPLVQPLLPDAGPVIHIQARRAAKLEEGAKAHVGTIHLLASCPAGLDTMGEEVRWQQVLKSIDNFNTEVLHFQAANPTGKGLYPLASPPWAVNHQLSKSSLAQNLYLTADAISIKAQKQREQLFWWLLGFGVVSILILQIYANLVFSPYLLLTTLLTSILGAVWFLRSQKQNLEGRYLDYRALAEACRVQYFWKILDLPHSVFNYYLRAQRDELEWIRQAVQTTELAPATEAPVSMVEKLEFVRNAWVDDQLRYFAGGPNKPGKAEFNRTADLKWTQWGTWLFGTGIALTFSTAVFHTFFANLENPAHDLLLHWLMFGFSIAFAASGLTKVYREIKAFSEHATLYDRMQLALQLTLQKLDQAIASNNTEQALEIIKELGIEALAENGNWLLMHRERPVLVRGIG